MTKKLENPKASSILKNISSSYLITDKNGIITYVSPYNQSIKVSKKKLLGSSVIDLVNETEKKQVTTVIKTLVKHPSEQKIITFYTKSNRKKRLLEATLTNLLDEDEINGILIILRDITHHPKITILEKEIEHRKQVEKELNENRKKYQLLIEHANEGICVAQDGYLKFVNPELCKILKYKEEEMLNSPFTLFIHPEDKELVKTRYTERLKGKNVPQEYVFRIIDKKKHIHWVQIHAARFLWDEKPATVNFLSEISKQIYSEMKYEKLIEIATLMIIEVDADDFIIKSVNSAFCNSVGIPAEKMIGKKATDVLPYDVFKDRYDMAQQAIIENRIKRLADQRNDKYFFNMFIPFDVPEGKRHLFVIAQDITDLKIIERKYKRLIDSSPDAIAEVDGNTHRILTLNPAMAKNFNLSKEKLIGHKWDEFMPKEVFEKRFKLGFKSISENKIRILEDERNGRFYQSTFVPIKISSNQTNLQIIARDITKQKKMENELRRAKETLEERVKERTINLEKTMKELKDSEQRYRSLIQTAPVVIAISDLKGNILDMNDVAKKIGVYDKKQKIFSTYYSSDNEKKKFYSKLNKQGSIRNWEFEFKNKQGEKNFGLLNIEQVKYKGKKGYLNIYQDITELKTAQENLHEIHDFLINVINSTSEFIFTLDENKNVTMWNKTAEAKIGIAASKIIGKNIKDVGILKNPQALLDYIKNISIGYPPSETDLIISNKEGSNLIFRISVSIMKEIRTDSIGYVVLGQDITQAKQLGNKIQLGSSYLQYKTSMNTYEPILIDIKTPDRPVLLVTRGSMFSVHQKTKQLDVDIVYLDDDEVDEAHVGNCEDLFNKISQYINNNENAVVIIDRLDFLMMKSSFEQVLSMIYQLTSLVNKSQTVLIVQINPDIYSTKQLNLLKEEMSLFQSTDIEDIALDEGLYKILSFIYTQNQRNIVVSYTKIKSEFNISKVTTGKRISELERKGFVSITLKGRMKSIIATKKAEDLLKKRSRQKNL